MPDIKACEKRRVDDACRALFVIRGGRKIPEVPFGVLLLPRPARRWERQMVEQGCEGLTRPGHHPPGGSSGTTRLSGSSAGADCMDRQSGCQLSNRAGARVWGGGACPTRSRESEGTPGRPRAQAGAAWRLLEASQAEPVGPRDVEWAGCRQAGSVRDRVPAAAGVQARLPRERTHPGASRAQGSWRAVCCPLCEPTGAVWKGDPAAPRRPRAHPLRVLLFSFRPTPTCRLSLGAPLITGEKKR